MRLSIVRAIAFPRMWVTIEAPSVSEIAAELGVDWICVDMEHGSFSYRHVLKHLSAVKGGDMAVIARAVRWARVPLHLLPGRALEA